MTKCSDLETSAIRIVTLTSAPILAGGVFLLLGSVFLGWRAGVVLAGGVIAIARGMARYDAGHGRQWIIYFYTFRDEAGRREYGRTIDPVLSCFGTTIEAVNRDGVPGALGAFLNVVLLRRVSTTGHLQLSNSDWQKDVLLALDEVALAVVDLATPSDNVLWELDAAAARLGAGRVIVLAPLRETSETPRVPGVTYLWRGSETLQQDLAKAVAQRILRVPLLKKAALKELLRRGCATPTFYALISLNILVQWLVQGLTLGERRSGVA